MSDLIQRLITVRSPDPEDARRRTLLNILLVGVAVLTLATLLVTSITALMGVAGKPWEVAVLLAAAFGQFAGLVAIYILNRARSGGLAAALFLLLLLGVILFADEPAELANGRSLFIFAIPVIMASVILKPYASFIMAGLTGAIVVVLAIQVNIVPNVPAILGFFVIALVSWLSSRSLERALDDLRAINRELDRRVMERTHDLAEALARVQAESGKNQAILESIADGVIVFGNDGTAIVANPALPDLIGLPTDAITGKDVLTLMGDHVNAESRAEVMALLQDEKLQRTATKFQWGKKTLSVSLAAVRDSSGASLGTVMVFRDFTREAELERMKSAFVSTASHELRTPLNAILGYSDMLKEEVYGPVGAEQVPILDRIIANTKRMLNLVNNILDQAQIEAGVIKITPSAFSPQRLVDELYEIMSILAEQKGLRLECEVAAGLPPYLWSDAHRLHQILVNLVGNAIKFTDTGSVCVKVEQPDPTHWTIQVSDTGMGIPPEAAAYIFEPFRQVDDSITRKHPGTGLGLAIVKQLVTLLGGTITLNSRLEVGSTFTVTLPLMVPQEEITA